MTLANTHSPALSLSLRPWPSQDSEESLKTTISRIFESRGHFKNLSEQSLEREIQTSQDIYADGLEMIEQCNEKEEELDPKIRREKLHAVKIEMLQNLKYDESCEFLCDRMLLTLMS